MLWAHVSLHGVRKRQRLERQEVVAEIAREEAGRKEERQVVAV